MQSPHESLSDEAWLAHYRETGEQEAVAVLLDRYADLITVMSLRYLPDEEAVRDFAMDLYLHLVEKLLDHDVRHFKGWLCRTVSNRLKDLTRKQKVRASYRQAALSAPLSMADGEKSRTVSLDLTLLKQALRWLNERERLCVEAVYFQQMSYEEAGQVLGWSANQVRGTRDRAVQKLRNWLGSSLGQYFVDL